MRTPVRTRSRQLYTYKPVDISALANKDWSKEMPRRPTGPQVYKGIPFNVPGDETKGALAVSSQKGFARIAVVPLHDTAACLYLLHTGMGVVTDNVYGTLTFKYTDSSEKTVYLFKEKQLSNWWFPKMENERTGVAWQGPNANSASVGLWWTAIDNPQPQKKIEQLIITSGAGESIYSLFALTLADLKHYIKPTPESYGGPDNWAAAIGMAALVEGLAGVQDEATAFRQPKLSPRWIAASTDSVDVCIKYAASDGYTAYRYRPQQISKANHADGYGQRRKSILSCIVARRHKAGCRYCRWQTRRLYFISDRAVCLRRFFPAADGCRASGNTLSIVNQSPCAFMKKIFIALLILPHCLLAQIDFAVTHLTTEYLNQPLALDTKEPRFGWNIASTKRDVYVGAYQIVVAKSIAALNEGKEWNSGKISSRNAVSATYNGQPLRSFATYYWRVKVWDEGGNASPWSETASFETGALSPSDWTAKWINDGSKNPERDEDYYKPDRMPLLRKQFPATKKVSTARLYVSGVGYFEPYLNGKKNKR